MRAWAAKCINYIVEVSYDVVVRYEAAPKNVSAPGHPETLNPKSGARPAWKGLLKVNFPLIFCLGVLSP